MTDDQKVSGIGSSPGCGTREEGLFEAARIARAAYAPFGWDPTMRNAALGVAEQIEAAARQPEAPKHVMAGEAHRIVAEHISATLAADAQGEWPFDVWQAFKSLQASPPREPTKEMLAAVTFDDGEQFMDADGARQLWQAMWDTALRQPSPTVAGEVERLRQALELAKREIKTMAEDATRIMRDMGRPCDAPERTWKPIMRRIDALLTPTTPTKDQADG